MLFIFNIQADEIADEIAVIQHRAAGSNTTSSLFYLTPTSLTLPVLRHYRLPHCHPSFMT